MTTIYRADQVGSFLRPPELKEARDRFARGETSADDLRAAEDAAILKVLDLQRQSGIPIFSDGEYRRSGWSGGFVESVNGYIPGEPAVRPRFQGGAGVATAPPRTGAATTSPTGGMVIGGRLSRHKRLTAHESGFLKEHAPGPFKVTMPAASYVVSRGYKPGVTDQVYGSRAEVLADAAAIIRQEIEALIAEGVTYIQIDNPHYPDYVSEERREEWRALGVDPDQSMQEDIEADNACLQGLDRANVTIGMHLCRGNGPGGAWHTSGGYDRIAEPVFNGIDVDVWLLEYDSERAGGFEPLRHMPRNKIAVLGLVTTKSGELEDEDLLVRRIEEASQHLPLQQLTLSPQCGFASTAAGNPLTWEDQLHKLELVVSTAQRVWGSV
jgi:5-methyltetrahydropteroyltriglutamate--homocysteine methyltransferase